MALKLWESQAGQKYRVFVAAETPEQANAAAQEQTGVKWLKFTSKEVTIPGHILDIRGENDDAGTSEAEDSGLDSPEEPEPGAESAAKPAADAQRQPASRESDNGRGKKTVVRSQSKGRRGR